MGIWDVLCHCGKAVPKKKKRVLFAAEKKILHRELSREDGKIKDDRNSLEREGLRTQQNALFRRGEHLNMDLP